MHVPWAALHAIAALIVEAGQEKSHASNPTGPLAAPAIVTAPNVSPAAE